MYKNLRKVYLKTNNLSDIPISQRHDNHIYICQNTQAFTYDSKNCKWILLSEGVEDYYTQHEVDNKLASLYDSLHNDFNTLTHKLENEHYTKEEMDLLLNNKQDKDV